jgi:hypothetical protein
MELNADPDDRMPGRGGKPSRNPTVAGREAWLSRDMTYTPSGSIRFVRDQGAAPPPRRSSCSA